MATQGLAIQEAEGKAKPTFILKESRKMRGYKCAPESALAPTKNGPTKNTLEEGSTIMPKPYAFSPDEFLSIHPVRIDALRGELDSAIMVLDFVTNAFHAANEQLAAYHVLSMVTERLEAISERLSPDAFRNKPSATEDLSHDPQ